MCFWFVFFKQKTAYEMRISDWSSDVCSSDLFLDVDLLRRCVDDDALADQGARRAPSPELIGLCASDDQAGPWLPDGKGLHAAPRIQARTWSVVVPTYWAASAARRVSGIALHCSSRSQIGRAHV